MWPLRLLERVLPDIPCGPHGHSRPCEPGLFAPIPLGARERIGNVPPPLIKYDRGPPRRAQIPVADRPPDVPLALDSSGLPVARDQYGPYRP